MAFKVAACLLMTLFVVHAQNCDPGVCANIPGTIYNAEIDGCSWADEIPGCSLQALGYNTDCDGMTSYQLKPVDFEFPNFDDPSLLNRRVNQYFVVCVPQTTDEDVQLYTEAREKYGRMVHLIANGPLTPRVLGCPGSMLFDAESSLCVLSDPDALPNLYAGEFLPVFPTTTTTTTTTPKPTTTTTPAPSEDADLIARIIEQLTPHIRESVSNSLVA